MTPTLNDHSLHTEIFTSIRGRNQGLKISTGNTQNLPYWCCVPAENSYYVLVLARKKHDKTFVTLTQYIRQTKPRYPGGPSTCLTKVRQKTKDGAKRVVLCTLKGKL